MTDLLQVNDNVPVLDGNLLAGHLKRKKLAQIRNDNPHSSGISLAKRNKTSTIVQTAYQEN